MLTANNKDSFSKGSLFFEQCQVAYEYSVSNYLWPQAAFYAERLQAECNCEATAYLLATVYFKLGKFYQVELLLNKCCESPASRYLLATSLLEQKKFDQADLALTQGMFPTSVPPVDTIPQGAAGLYLLGNIREKAGNLD
eukprot:Platyproteum_vivax@DN8729_c0_g1_i1.p1